MSENQYVEYIKAPNGKDIDVKHLNNPVLINGYLRSVKSCVLSTDAGYYEYYAIRSEDRMLQPVFCRHRTFYTEKDIGRQVWVVARESAGGLQEIYCAGVYDI